jgi:OOP family OmpA-OmpF porin
MVVIAVFSLSTMVGCARIAGVAKDDYRDGNYYPTCLVDADRALYDARMAGRDKECPDEYNALKDMADRAVKTHLACNTDGACKMAQDVAVKARNISCPPKPRPEMKPEPAPVPPPPAPLAPTSNLTVTPGSIMQGETAMLNWTSENTTNCDIQPGIGPVKTQGAMKVSPPADTAYDLNCTGPGGTTSSATNLKVTAPPKPEPAPEMLCYKLDIEFDTAKWNIKPQYHDELVKLANFMKDYPDLKGVIEGHTDNKAGAAYNQKLSEKRARSVRDYLVNKLGIDGSRLTAKGFGLSKPEADNSTVAGRQKNRRVVANFACVEKKRK